LVITFTVASVWALMAGQVGGFLQSRRAFQSVLRAGGGLMIIAGAGMALALRSS
jgi:threonine/homoserine/homoserine lactone efflux protein